MHALLQELYITEDLPPKRVRNSMILGFRLLDDEDDQVGQAAHFLVPMMLPLLLLVETEIAAHLLVPVLLVLLLEIKLASHSAVPVLHNNSGQGIGFHNISETFSFGCIDVT